MNSITASNESRKISRNATKRICDQISKMSDDKYKLDIGPIADSDEFSRVASLVSMTEDEDRVKNMLCERDLISEEECEHLLLPDLLQICLSITDAKINRSSL